MRMIIRTVTVFLLTLTAAAIIGTAPATAAPAASYKLLHSFSGTDGGSPTGLLQASDGFFYGAAANGGDVNACSPDGCGTLFKSDSSGNLTVLHVFHATDGYGPTGLVKGLDGNFYGTTASGGQPSGGGAGTFFRIDPAGNFKVLYAFVGGFACCDGSGPVAQPVLATDGNFYGTTVAGGGFRNIDHQGGMGAVYQFNPTTGLMAIIHSFNLTDGNGIFPNGPLIQAKDGFLYGTTREGGASLFKVDTSGNLTRLAALTGTQPLSGVIQATDGSFYGTDEGGSGAGSVYRVDAAGNLVFVNRFDGTDGYRPNLRLLQARDGFFYGVTPQGGMLDFQGGDIFRLNAGGILRVLHSFRTTGTEGFAPNSQLVQGADGALYGSTGIGGVGGHGTIFRLDQRVLGPVASLTVNPTTIHSGQTSKGTVTLSSPAPTGGMVITLGAQQGQIVIPSTVTVPAGAKTATFTIKTLKIGAVVTVRIYASFNGQGLRTTLTVMP
jgi:uncharacterized repeat protein (TIGR03803 family)